MYCGYFLKMGVKIMDDIGKVVQDLAEEMASLDREQDSERIKTIKEEITFYEINTVKNFQGMAYFPLFRNRLDDFNGKVPFDEFCSLLRLELWKLFDKYDPTKNVKFSTFFMSSFKYRVLEEIAKEKKRIGELLPKDPNGKKSNAELKALGTYSVDFTGFSNEYKVWLDLGETIVLKKENETHSEKYFVKNNYFKEFYTYDTTKFTNIHSKAKMFEEEEVIESGDFLFPILKPPILAILLEGEIDNIEHVVYNDAKDELRFSEPGLTRPGPIYDAIMVCYGISEYKARNQYHDYLMLFKAYGNLWEHPLGERVLERTRRMHERKKSKEGANDAE